MQDVQLPNAEVKRYRNMISGTSGHRISTPRVALAFDSQCITYLRGKYIDRNPIGIGNFWVIVVLVRYEIELHIYDKIRKM